MKGLLSTRDSDLSKQDAMTRSKDDILGIMFALNCGGLQLSRALATGGAVIG